MRSTATRCLTSTSTSRIACARCSTAGCSRCASGTTPTARSRATSPARSSGRARRSATWKRAWSIRASATAACSSRCCGSCSAARRDRGMLGLHGEAVTVHPYSQKSNLALGFTEMGVQLGDEAPTVDFKPDRGRGAEASARRPCSTTSRQCEARVAHRVRAAASPRDDRAPLRARRVPARARATSPGPSAPAARTPQVRVDAFPELERGVDPRHRLRRRPLDLVRFRLRELCLRRIDWICLDLPLSAPGGRRSRAPRSRRWDSSSRASSPISSATTS